MNPRKPLRFQQTTAPALGGDTGMGGINTNPRYSLSGGTARCAWETLESSQLEPRTAPHMR
eukprot:6090215-Amphidinium_carterae.1